MQEEGQVSSSRDTVPSPDHEVGGEEGQVSNSYDTLPLPEHKVVG
jgi:hypothetical protein